MKSNLFLFFRRSQYWHAHLVVFGIVLAAALAMAKIYAGYSSIGTDGVFYAGMAKSLAEGRGLEVFGVPHTVYSPLLPIFISLPYALGMPLEEAAHLPIVAFALATIVGVYVIGRNMHSETAGVLSALFLAVSGMYLWSAGTSVSPQFVGGFFALIAFVSLLGVEQESPRRMHLCVAAAGAGTALAYLARPEYIVLLVPALFYIVVVLRHVGNRKEAWRAPALFVLAFFLFALPYVVYLHDTLGYWTISGRGNELAIIVTSENYEAVDELGGGVSTVVAPPELKESALALVARELPMIGKRLADGLVNTEHTLLRLFGFVGLYFLALGLRFLLTEKKLKEIVLIGVFLLPVVLIAFAQGGTPNYLVQFFFLLTPLVAIGLFEGVGGLALVYGWKESVRRLWVVTAALICAGYFFLPAAQNFLFLPADYRDIEYRQIGLWMRENIEDISEKTIISRKPEPAFYAGALWTIVPYGKSVSELAELMKNSGQEYLIADDRNLPSSRPELADLLFPKKVERYFELIHEEHYQGKRAFLYKAK